MDPDSMSSSIPMENLTDGDHALETAVILIMGPSGSGKSHFIQAALGDSSIKAGKEPGSGKHLDLPAQHSPLKDLIYLICLAC